ncbi:hypothetical protein PYCCODRAFT_1478791 [Trametes coccinea BRFM310]|uniref:DUF4470 domain-containing protein n=1 Tax=Trametes coccinea (strain BRFM310) TaxID=1353009 RepID=A0A1Y2IM48_TRAC3|nr:hypothetical protein PYCCODRAFT_1478791 [Trametes coccinea BRFM310]
MALNAKVAAEFKKRGNDAFKTGNFVKAVNLYSKAEKSDPRDPVYPSNLSAALFEAGNYVACIDAVLRAYKLLKEQQEPADKSSLLIRLSSRLAKALLNSAQSDPETLTTLKKYEAEYQELKENAFSTPSSAASTSDLSRVWYDWESFELQLQDGPRNREACLRELSKLPPFMKPLDDGKEYYSIGHDPVIDLTAGFGSEMQGKPASSLNISKLSTARLSQLAFLFGGVGDGRHAFGTLAGLFKEYQQLSENRKAAFHAHLTFLDIHPTAIARDLSMLVLLNDLNNATKPLTRTEIKATLMYTFCGLAMPSYCYDILMNTAKSLCEKLTEHPPALPPWLHVEAKSIPAILRALDYWINTEKSTSRVLAREGDYNLDEELEAFTASGGAGFRSEVKTLYDDQRKQIEKMFRELPDDKLLELPWMPHGVTVSQARTIIESNMDELVRSMQQLHATGKVPTHERAWYKVAKVFLPPAELRSRHPGFDTVWEKLVAGGDFSPSEARKIATHVTNQWKANITLYDAMYNDPKYHPDGDGYRTSSGDAFEAVNFIEDFVNGNKPRKNGITNTVDTLAWDIFNAFFDKIAKAIEGLGDHLTIELLVGGLAEELAKMRTKADVTRPAAFPRKFTRMWLSNVPDYTHGPMNMALYVVPNLQDLPEAGASCNCLLNTGSWENDDSYFYNYTYLLIKDVPRYLGCQVINPQAVMDVLVLGSLPLPRPRSELASRDELTNWLTRVLFSTFLPGKPRLPPQSVRLPHNIVAFFELLMHLSRVGFPVHWLSDFLARVLSGSMVSDIAPYSGFLPIPLSEMHRRVPSRRVRTDPWLVEFENIIATGYHAIPFPIAYALPEGFSREPEDIRVWEVRTTPTQPFAIMWGFFSNNGSPYEPTARLLFYRPSQTTPAEVIKGLHSVFEGATSHAPGSFFILTAQDVMQYDKRIRFRLSRRRVEKMKEEKWAMLAYRQDTGLQAIKPVPVDRWLLVEEY